MHRIFLIAASLFVAWGMHFELIRPGLYMDDGEFHLSVLKALDQAFQNGRNPLDFWFAGTPFGFALFRTYQSLPYLLMYSVYVLLAKSVSLGMILSCSNIILAMLLPWSLYLSMKLFRFSYVEAVVTGVASVLVADGGEFGFGLQYYTFGNNGLFTQLWALVCLPLALAFSYRFIKEGAFLGWALLFSFLTFGCHVISAFILLFSLAVIFIPALVTFNQPIIKRGVLFLGFLGAVTSYQWLCTFIDAPYINQSLLEPIWKYEGHGLRYVLSKIVTGDSIDHERFPVMTLFMIIGVSASIWGYGWNDRAAKSLQRLVLSCFAVFITLYAGREVWGWLFRDMPALKSLHMHRFAIGYQLYALMLIGIGVGALLWEARNSKKIFSVLVLILMVSTAPLFQERMKMYRHAGTLRIASDVYLKQHRTAHEVVEALEPGVVYAGATHNWQKETEQFGIPMHFFVTAAGFPTVGGALYHAFALSGETLFDFDVKRRAHFELYGIHNVIAPSHWNGFEGFVRTNNFQQTSVWKTDHGMLTVGKAAFNLCGDKSKASNFLRLWVQSPLVEAKQFGILTDSNCQQSPSFPEVRYTTVPPAVSNLPAPGRVISEEGYLPWKTAGKVVANSDDIVVLATSFHPQWEARVDGQKLHTMWVTPGFIAAKVPAGEHEISFEYKGSSLKTVLFFLGIIGIYAIFISQKKSPT